MRKAIVITAAILELFAAIGFPGTHGLAFIPLGLFLFFIAAVI